VAHPPGEPLSRRRVLLAAATASGAVATAGLLGGCGSSSPAKATRPEIDGADADVLDALLAVENRATAAYAHAARLLSGEHQALARRLGAQEAAHAYALTGAIDALGGVPTPAQASYAFSARTASDALRLAAQIEDTSIAACLDALPKLTDLRARGTVAGVVNSDAEHAVLVAQARGLPALATAIVNGRT
jgi:hypothetical protein